MDSLRSKILTGDREAFKEWMEMHIQPIERLAIIYGLTPQDAGKMVETIFRDLYNDFGQLTEERLEENRLFKIALRNLEGIQAEVSEVDVFPFQEDNELLARLIELPREERFVFILSQFNQKSIGDIAWIIDQPVEHVSPLLQKAIANLDGSGPYIDKRLEFLNKSIHRLKPSYNERNIFYTKPKDAMLPPDGRDQKASRSKKPLLLWLAGSVILIFIMSVTVLKSDAYQQSSAEKFIANKQMSFQKELDDRFELIGLSEPDDLDTNFLGYRFAGNEIYGIETKREFERFISQLEKDVENEGKIDKREAAKQYNALVHELRLPSEMLEQLRKEPITDRDQSMEFLNEFSQKNDFLATAYMGVFGEHAEFIWGSESELVGEGMVDIEEFMKKKPEFPIELQKAIDGMETQHYSLATFKNYMPLSLTYTDPEVKETLQQNLHPDMNAYIFVLTGGTDVLYDGTEEEQLEVLLVLEKEMSKTKQRDPLVRIFDGHYSWLFYSLVGMVDGNGIYDVNFVVKPEVREKWVRLSTIGENSPAAQVMQEIITEMEATNWKTSLENDIQTQLYERINRKLQETRKTNE